MVVVVLLVPAIVILFSSNIIENPRIQRGQLLIERGQQVQQVSINSQEWGFQFMVKEDEKEEDQVEFSA